MDTQENWAVSQKIIIILAHPDDPEFFLGATIARWVKSGHCVSYCLLTHGEKGSSDPSIPPEILAATRVKEQQDAGKVLGVSNIRFLNYIDGELTPDLQIKKEIVRVIREEKPNVIVTCDPTNFYINDVYINHPDHRAAGLAVIDAVFPAAGNPLYYPDLLAKGLEPHSPREVWLCLTSQPNVTLDVTEFWQNKIDAVLKHRSQIPNPDLLIERQRARRTSDSTDDTPKYEDRFHRLIFR